MRIRSGWLRGSIYRVLLFWDSFAVTKPLSQKRRSTFLQLQDANLTPSIGGFGLSRVRHQVSVYCQVLVGMTSPDPAPVFIESHI